MARQYSLFKQVRKNTKLWWIREAHCYGGALKYRKVARPFDSKKLSHVVFKANVGKSLRFTKSRRSIEKLIKYSASRYRVKIDRLAINHDHIHVLSYSPKKQNQTLFLRYFAAEMGRKYKILREHFGLQAKTLWLQRPFTRLVSWSKRSLATARAYVEKNKSEAMGFLPYEVREHRITEFLERWKFGNSS